MKLRLFSRPWSSETTKRARSFYFVAGRFFLALGVGERHRDAPELRGERHD